MTAFAPPATATATALGIKLLQLFFFGQHHFNSKIRMTEHVRQIYQLSQNMNQSTAFGRSPGGDFSGLRILQTHQRLALGDGVNQNNWAQLS